MSSPFPDRETPAPIPTGPNDRYFDYCLQPYRPRTSPVGRLRSENLLWAALTEAGSSSLRPALKAIQDALGRDMTVWGIKYAGDVLWLELYFYDPQKQDTKATVRGLTEILAPFVDIVPRVPEHVPYMMASFDLRADTLATGRIEEVNLYLTGTDEHAGRSYKVNADGAQLDNVYRFLRPKAEIDVVLSLTQSSVFVDYAHSDRTLSRVILAKLFACKRICVAKKRLADGIYYSGIDVEQLLWFLREFSYPQALVEYLAARRTDFEHLYFDVGFDYRQTDDGAIVYPKSSFYGTL